MKALVVHDSSDSYDNPDVADTFEQIESVSAALDSLSIESSVLPFSLDVPSVRKNILREKFDFIFNLVESVEGRGIFIHYAPVLFDSMKISYTGNSSEALFITSNKLASKKIMRYAGIPTADWMEYSAVKKTDPDGCRYIIKSYWEHASIGIDDESVFIFDSRERALELFDKKRSILGSDIFAEKFISGREFNISVISDKDGNLRVLHPAEMTWNDAKAGDNIMSYNSKWVDDTEEYSTSCRTFDFPSADSALIERLKKITLETAKLFSLNGYARVDFRVDDNENIYVLEINANPCLSPDSGIAAACLNEGISYNELIDLIVRNRISR
ncbi:MAG: ATP-grasp domain-containing protein [Spirochaetes bacterium]|nr:ATP-grasp domain-containing protein [Spirochaetota bacterium]